MKIKVLLQRFVVLLPTLGIAAFAVFAIHGYMTSDSKHLRTIESIEPGDGKVIIHLDDGRALDVILDTSNLADLPLFYPGKKVWVVKAEGLGTKLAGQRPCWDITPVAQENMPLLTPEQYRKLIAEGFTDSDLSNSFTIPKGIDNPNAEPPADGMFASGAPMLCAEVR